jgi:phospholipase C
MKKIFATLLSLLLIVSISIPNVFASANNNYGGIDILQYTDSELDLSQYTINDLINMSADDYLDLVREFERVYDPYDSYDAAAESIDSESAQASGEGAELEWKSGELTDGEWTESGTHEYITSVACLILSTDKGFFSTNATAVVAITLSISLASLLPDEDENWDGGYYAAHFYNPYTEKNYLSSSSQTAKTKAISHFSTATAAAANGDMDTAYEYIGRCLHYIQDANEPHHAANKVSTGVNAHAKFEAYAQENMETFLENYTSISSSCYTYALANDIGTILKAGALSAYALIDNCNSASNKSGWSSCAETTLKNAAKYSAEVLYKFSRYAGVPFVNN